MNSSSSSALCLPVSTAPVTSAGVREQYRIRFCRTATWFFQPGRANINSLSCGLWTPPAALPAHPTRIPTFAEVELKHPACASADSLAVTKSGRVFSWKQCA
ncbi:hypothetical protein PF010_g25327 [Phytophthora fragariae]|uniref:Uncharacterized protein n=1 Tax=Phytophthora fragariae TaxID=53985 RepID=A0A6A3YDL3_9STRA|nr:hypothetical protein PF003_g27450 [Phytophthora fragariae]KAE8925749.1 hypothetical protein PF009_g24050 [Phytophthora fragariae]KAE8980676.1 hypothetical protein PF011_g22339 [Phytophthora fragariae]KAE9072829.1 hypothetical protein PF010_g25327 [Phytophthora fragariae]KAE9091068.1 hypothetical protein PF006_g25010 [Phytophthora fragariae]